MKVEIKLFFYFAIISCTSAASMGPIGKITISSIYECEEKSSNDKVALNIDIKTIDTIGTKALFGNCTSSVFIDDTVKYELVVLKWDNSGWKPVIKRKGLLCTDVKMFVGDIYANIAKQMKPNVPAQCPIPPGTYRLDNFKAAATDVKMPVVHYGKLKATVKFLLENDVVFCTVAEINSQSLI